MNKYLTIFQGKKENGRVKLTALLMDWGNKTAVQAYQCSCNDMTRFWWKEKIEPNILSTTSSRDIC